MTKPTSQAVRPAYDPSAALARKPFVAPVVRPQGTMAIQAGSMNLWDMK